MKYEKPQIEFVKFDCNTFIACSGDVPIGSFTCGSYTQGGTCINISWSSSGYSCASYTNGHCSGVSSPSGSTGDGCHAWKLTCSKF